MRDEAAWVREELRAANRICCSKRRVWNGTLKTCSYLDRRGPRQEQAWTQDTSWKAGSLLLSALKKSLAQLPAVVRAACPSACHRRPIPTHGAWPNLHTAKAAEAAMRRHRSKQ